MINDILNVGISTIAHNKNVKKRGSGKTIKGWTKSLLTREIIVKEATDASDCGNTIREYMSSTAKDSGGNSCDFATRLLGANNRALSIPTENGNVEVFPSQSFDVAKQIFSALMDAVKNEPVVQKSIVNQLNAKGFKGKVEHLTQVLEGGS